MSIISVILRTQRQKATDRRWAQVTRTKRARQAGKKSTKTGKKVIRSWAGRNKTAGLLKLSSIIDDLAGKGAGKYPNFWTSPHLQTHRHNGNVPVKSVSGF